MSVDIFVKNAPKYWDYGMPVMPLFRAEKRPIISQWSRWHDVMPDEAEREAWVSMYPDSNLGLVLGKQSRVVAFDIDTEDVLLTEKILKLLPPSPWKRVGKKGMVLAYKWNGLKTFRVKTEEGASICELLSDRTQVVLPPSIHPETKRPYEANCALWEVVSILHELPHDIEDKIRKLLTEEGIKLSHSGWTKVTEYVASGNRDSKLTELAGLFAMSVTRGDRTLKEAIGMLESYHDTFVQKVAGDAMDMQKHVANLLGFLNRDVLVRKKILPEGWDAGLTQEDKVKLGVTFSVEVQEWKASEIKDYLYKVYSREDAKGGQESMTATNEMLNKIALSKNLLPIEVEDLVAYIVKNSGIGLKAGSLMRQIRTIKSEGGIQGLNHTEIARAMLEDLQQLYTIRFHAESFWKWVGSHWEQVNENWLVFKLSEAYGHMPGAKRQGDMAGIIKLMRTMVDEGLGNGVGVNFANGFLTQDLVLRKHDESFGMTYTLPFRYLGTNMDMERHAPMFWKFLDQCWGHEADFQERILLLQEMLCVTLFGLGARYQRAYLLHGVPRSGKTQMLNIFSSLVPAEARSAVSPSDWADKFMPTMMFGKLLNVAGELHEKKRIDGQRFKDITDGSEITGQHKFGKPFRMRIMATQLFAANHLPKTEDSSDGFNRRWAVLTFTRQVPQSERIADIGDLIVAAEREVIVAWAVQALARLQENHDYTLPHSHSAAVEEMSAMNNPIRAFLRQSNEVKVTKLEKDVVSEEQIYQKFWNYSITIVQKRPEAVAEFRAKMRELAVLEGFKVIRRGVEDRWDYIGLACSKK